MSEIDKLIEELRDEDRPPDYWLEDGGCASPIIAGRIETALAADRAGVRDRVMEVLARYFPLTVKNMREHAEVVRDALLSAIGALPAGAEEWPPQNTGGILTLTPGNPHWNGDMCEQKNGTEKCVLPKGHGLHQSMLRSDLRWETRTEIADAFRRGAEASREQAADAGAQDAQVIVTALGFIESHVSPDNREAFDRAMLAALRIPQRIRSLPLPEDK